MSYTDRDPEPQSLPVVWPTLRILYSGAAGISADQTLVPQGPKTAIGRTAAASEHLALSSDRRTSERHAEFRMRRHSPTQTPHMSIYDVGSSNGTFVNGRRVVESPLHDGDIVRVGDSFILIRCEPAQRSDSPVDLLPGSAPAMRQLRVFLKQASASEDPVLLLGESGSGKELSAQALHRLSGRSGPLLTMNCAAIPAELAESQLFGHEKGAFSGALRAHPGYFRAAHRGTLFLDEIGDLPPSLQPKLLRVLEEQAVAPLGSTVASPFDVRVVAATNRDLRQAVASQTFRGDLYARLVAIVVHVPPLRARREDILPLLFSMLGDTSPGMTARLIEALLIYRWPYNVRELKQIAAALRLHLRAGELLDLPLIVERLPLDDPFATLATPEVTPPPSAELLRRLMEEHGGIVARVASAVGRSHRHVRRLLEQHKIDAKQFSQPKGRKRDA